MICQLFDVPLEDDKEEVGKINPMAAFAFY